MLERARIQIEMIKLLNGDRLIRLTDPQSGLSLEKKLDPAGAVIRQKDHLFQVFDAALARAETIGA